MPWYAMQVGAGKEELVSRLVRQHVPDVEQVMAPIAVRAEAKADVAGKPRVATRREKLFPGYVFLCVRALSGAVYRGVAALRDAGARSILDQAEVTDEEMARVAWHLMPELVVPEEAVEPRAARRAEKAPRPKPYLTPEQVHLLRVVIQRIRVQRSALAAAVRRTVRTVLVPAAELSRILSCSLPFLDFLDTS